MSTTGLQAASSQNAYRLWDRQRGQIEVMMHDFPIQYIAFRPIAPDTVATAFHFRALFPSDQL
jgi:hypothetical protein